MHHLRDGSLLTVWPRTAAVVSRVCASVAVPLEHRAALTGLALGGSVELPDALIDLLGEHLVSGAAGVEDPWLRQRFADLDQGATGWLPGFWARERQRIADTESMHSRRRMWATPRSARASLPASTVLRAQALQAISAERIYLDDDVDGLGVLLAASSSVVVCEPREHHREWLSAEARRAGVEGQLTAVEAVASDAQFDLTVIHAGPPARFAAALTRAVALTRSGGHIAVSVRAPWEGLFLEQSEAAGLSVVTYLREVDHWVLPSGLVIDGAGDLAILERPETAQVNAVEEDVAERLRQRPYFNVDLDSLDSSRLDDAAVGRFVDAVAARAARPEAFRSIRRDGERHVLCWYDELGIGFSGELRHDEAHLMLTLMPYDVDLEYVSLCAAYEEFADSETRARPIRTRRWQEEGLFG